MKSLRKLAAPATGFAAGYAYHYGTEQPESFPQLGFVAAASAIKAAGALEPAMRLQMATMVASQADAVGASSPRLNLALLPTFLELLSVRPEVSEAALAGAAASVKALGAEAATASAEAPPLQALYSELEAAVGAGCGDEAVLSVAAMLLVATAWVSALEERVKVTARVEAGEGVTLAERALEIKDWDAEAQAEARSKVQELWTAAQGLPNAYVLPEIAGLAKSASHDGALVVPEDLSALYAQLSGRCPDYEGPVLAAPLKLMVQEACAPPPPPKAKWFMPVWHRNKGWLRTIGETTVVLAAVAGGGAFLLSDQGYSQVGHHVLTDAQRAATLAALQKVLDEAKKQAECGLTHAQPLLDKVKPLLQKLTGPALPKHEWQVYAEPSAPPAQPLVFQGTTE